MERDTRLPAPNFQITFYKTTVSWVWTDELGVQNQLGTKINLGSRHPRLGKKKERNDLNFLVGLRLELVLMCHALFYFVSYLFYRHNT